MKDILVEFTDHGAIIHKAPSVIEAKKDLPYCFLNPDLSNVGGVSPSYWVYNEEGQIVMASPEERKRRDEYHENKPPENTVSFKQTLDAMHEEISADFEEDIKELSDTINKKIEDLECINKQIINTFDIKIIDLNNFIIKSFNENKEFFALKIDGLQKENKMLKIALIINVILTIILKAV